jgi:hypothetical protein
LTAKELTQDGVIRLFEESWKELVVENAESSAREGSLLLPFFQWQRLTRSYANEEGLQR